MVYLFYPNQAGSYPNQAGSYPKRGWKQEFAIFITKVKSTVCIENKFTVGGD